MGRQPARVRAAAASAVHDVVHDGRSLSDVLPGHRDSLEEPADRSMAQALTYGALRFYPRYERLARQLLSRPIREGDEVLRALLAVGFYQLAETTIPVHAAVAETVAATRVLRRPHANGLVNAVLRRFIREKDGLTAGLMKDPVARHAHPGWWIDRVRADWPDDWERVLEAANQQAPMWLRVNLRASDVESCQARLKDAGLPARGLEFLPAGLRLRRAADVRRLPGFDDGHLSVQDGAAQLAADLVLAGLPDGPVRILDACAAPGGKTAAVLERRSEATVTALDSDAARLGRVTENLERLGLEAAVVHGDAASPDGWWDGEPYDRVLLDAPCSASGVARRHPDIKCLRRDDDIGRLAARQAAMLEALWPLVRPGGRLLYCTCSIFVAENADVVRAFLARHADAAPSGLPADTPWGRPSGPGRQILPGETGMDGFYYACLRKSKAAKV